MSSEERESVGEASERDVSGLANWSISSSKPGQGLKELRSPDPALFWQSDGPQPHSLSLVFPKRTLLSRIDLCLDFTQDESYTPSSISIRAGNSLGDLTQVTTVEFHEPTGWSPISLLLDEGR
jgi:anaphase-promoting complex subunit 10